MLYTHHSYFQNIFTPRKENLHPLISCSPFLLLHCPWQQPIFILPLWIYLFWIVRINGITQHAKFCVWILSFSIIFLWFIHGVAFISTPFILFMVESHFIVGLYYILFIHFFIDGHLDYFHHVAIVNSAAVNTHLWKLLKHLSADALASKIQI